MPLCVDASDEPTTASDTGVVSEYKATSYLVYVLSLYLCLYRYYY